MNYTKEELRQISVQLNKLPWIYNTVMFLYYFDEMSPADLSLILGLSELSVNAIRENGVLMLQDAIWETEAIEFDERDIPLLYKFELENFYLPDSNFREIWKRIIEKMPSLASKDI